MSLEMNQIYEELGIQKEVYEFGRKAEEELAPGSVSLKRLRNSIS